MHEHGLMNDVFKVVKKVAKENNLKKIKKVTISVGKMQQIVPETLKQAFDHICEHEGIVGAELDVITEPITFKCRKCNEQFQSEEQAGICPKCDGVSLEVISGRNVIVKSVEGE